jgi:hypothetical protein
LVAARIRLKAVTSHAASVVWRLPALGGSSRAGGIADTAPFALEVGRIRNSDGDGGSPRVTTVRALESAVPQSVLVPNAFTAAIASRSEHCPSMEVSSLVVVTVIVAARAAPAEDAMSSEDEHHNGARSQLHDPSPLDTPKSLTASVTRSTASDARADTRCLVSSSRVG